MIFPDISSSSSARSRDFEPSAGSFAPAVRALGVAHGHLAKNGVIDPRHLDLWTALITGLVDQQVSNDPGGDRWVRLIDDAVAMFLAYCQPPAPTAVRPPPSSSRTKGVHP